MGVEWGPVTTGCVLLGVKLCICWALWALRM